MSAERDGLRARQMRLGREAILDAALALFGSRGYSKTTIQMIADRAGVGVATVFRHCGSKAGVFAALARRDVEGVLDAGRAIIEDAPAEPGPAMAAMLIRMMKVFDLPAWNIRESELLWLGVPTGNAATDAMVRWADAELQGLIRQMLRRFRAAGALNRACALDDMVFVCFAVFNEHYLRLSTDSGVTRRAVENALRRQIPLLFQSWVVSRAGAPSRPVRRTARTT